MAILHDYWCKFCGTSFEEMVEWDQREVTCKNCNGHAERYYKSGCANNMPIDAAWLKTLVDVVDKDTQKSHCVEFLKNQTRENYHKWMAGEGIRHIEQGERLAKPEPFDAARHTDKVMALKQQRERIEIGGR